MIPVSEIWQYWLDHKKEMESKHICVADIPTEGVEVYLTNDYGYPSFTVDVDGRTEYDEIAVDQTDTEDTYNRILSLVLRDTPDDTPPEVPDKKDASENKTTENEDVGSELLSKEDQNRIDEISDAVYAFISVLMEASPEDAGFDESELEKVAEEIEDLLCKKFGALTRHPTLIPNKETGVFEVVQYPYA